MGAFSYLRSIYDLDTLDTRYTITSKTPYKTYVESRNDPGASKARAAKFGSRVQPSKWRTPEFYMYGVVMAVVIPAMLWVTYSVSRRMAAEPAPLPSVDKSDRALTEYTRSFESPVQEIRAVSFPGLGTRSQDRRQYPPTTTHLHPAVDPL